MADCQRCGKPRVSLLDNWMGAGALAEVCVCDAFVTHPMIVGPDRILISHAEARAICAAYGELNFENWMKYHGVYPGERKHIS